MPDLVRTLKADAKFQAKLLRRLWRRAGREAELKRNWNSSLKDCTHFLCQLIPEKRYASADAGAGGLPAGRASR